MSRPLNDQLHGDLRVLFDVGSIAGMSDGDLLDRFASRNDEAAELAFAAIVERHGPAVWRICRKNLTCPHSAEDAFQATFLVLARRVASIRNRDSVGGWLRGVADRVSARARLDEFRRRGHERLAAAARSEVEAPPAADDAAALLLEELERLPKKYRDVVMLCDLQGQSYEEAARLEGIPAGTLKSRLARGRERLRDRLVRRGIAPAIAAGILSASSRSLSAAYPLNLSARTVEIATRFISAGGTSAPGISAAVAAMIEGCLWSMTLMTLRTFGFAASVAGIIVVGSIAPVLQGSGLGQSPGKSAPTPPTKPKSAGGSRVSESRPAPDDDDPVVSKSVQDNPNAIRDARELPLRSPAEGARLKQIVEHGARVTVGQVIAEFDASELEARELELDGEFKEAELLELEAKARLDLAKSETGNLMMRQMTDQKASLDDELRIAAAEFEVARTVHERAKAAVNKGVATELELLKAKVDLVKVEASIRKREAALRSLQLTRDIKMNRQYVVELGIRLDLTRAMRRKNLAQSQLKALRSIIKSYRITAPADGVVFHRPIFRDRLHPRDKPLTPMRDSFALDDQVLIFVPDAPK